MRTLLALLGLVGVCVGCAPNHTIDRMQAPAGSGGTQFDPGTGGSGGISTGGAGGPADVAPPPIACGEIQPWMPEGPYKMGSKVTAGAPLHVFECRPWPNEGWCPMAAYEPAKTDAPWSDAWLDVGPCPEKL